MDEIKEKLKYAKMLRDKGMSEGNIQDMLDAFDEATEEERLGMMEARTEKYLNGELNVPDIDQQDNVLNAKNAQRINNGTYVQDYSDAPDVLTERSNRRQNELLESLGMPKIGAPTSGSPVILNPAKVSTSTSKLIVKGPAPGFSSKLGPPKVGGE